MFRSENSSYLSVPFYSVRDDKVYYLPAFTYERSCRSNGMAAGHPEEAIVQIFQKLREWFKETVLEQPLCRKCRRTTSQSSLCLRDFQKVEGDGWLLCGHAGLFLGRKVSVAALFISNLDTGNFGLKLGCHPDFGVAMERTLTEATQGCDIDVYSTRSKLDFNNTLVDHWINISNSFKIGLAQYPYQLFNEEKTYEFTPAPDVSQLSNAEIMKKMFDDVLADGYDILLRDVSFLNFGSFHVIIPGLSDVEPQTTN